jgi:hypothetical protein
MYLYIYEGLWWELDEPLLGLANVGLQEGYIHCNIYLH